MTTFDHYWQLVRRLLPRMVLLSLAITAVSLAMVARLGATYTVHFSYLVSLSEREAGSDFRFDGFYALQATDLFAATLAQWMMTPETIVAAYRVAGVWPEPESSRELASVVRARKTAPQLISVSVSHKKEAVAQRLTAGMQEVMRENVTLYHDEGIPALQYQVVADTSWTEKREPERAVISIATFVFSLFFMINAVLLWESFRRVE